MKYSYITLQMANSDLSVNTLHWNYHCRRPETVPFR